MNTPGLGDTVINEAKDINGNQRLEADHSNGINMTESNTRLRWTAEDRELDQFLQPTRWWFASTEIPLIAVRFHLLL